MQPLQKGRPIDFHTSNIQRAQTKRLVLPIVRLGNPILRPPEGRSLRKALSVNGVQEQNAFSGATALFRVQRLFFAYFFLTSQKKVCRRRHSAPIGAENGLSAHPQWACGAILRRMAQKTGKGSPPFRFLSFQKAHGNNGRCRLRSRRRSGCGNRPWPAARPLRRWSYSRSPRS